jgi:nicotinamide riboside transporter PnuC
MTFFPPMWLQHGSQHQKKNINLTKKIQILNWVFSLSKMQLLILIIHKLHFTTNTNHNHTQQKITTNQENFKNIIPS